MTASFYEQPILNSPYEPPSRHHALDDDGQPLDEPPREGNRLSKLITPVPKARKKQGKSKQGSFVMPDANDLSTDHQEYNPPGSSTRSAVMSRPGAACPIQATGGCLPRRSALLMHWREHEFAQQKPFFCQIEAVETVI